MTQRNIFAWTAPGSHYPHYVSLNQQEDGTFTLDVREPAQNGNCGHTSRIEIPRDQIRVMGKSCLAGGDQGLKIDHDIPLPSHRGSDPILTALNSMQIGDSFIWPNEGDSPQQVHWKIYKFGKRYCKKFAYRTEAANIRVWRLT